MDRENTEDLHVARIRPLISPAVLQEEIEASERVLEQVLVARRNVEDVLAGKDKRQIVVVGPCSIHDPIAAVDYAGQLQEIAATFSDQLIVIMRVYFEKPRTVVGWKGLINDPDLDESYHINKGLRLARKLLVDILEIGLPTGTEFLDTTFGQFYADLVSWGAIGARTAESQIHRELASGLSMPVGIKNRTDGDIQVAIDGIKAAGHRHLFPTLTKEGAPAIYETTGNQYCHLILRGGNVTGPNFDVDSVSHAADLLQSQQVTTKLMIDCSHGNSEKDPNRQIEVIRQVCQQIRNGQQAIGGVMLESHLQAGRQDYVAGAQLAYGQSITDGCISLEQTAPLLEQLADAIMTR